MIWPYLLAAVIAGLGVSTVFLGPHPEALFQGVVLVSLAYLILLVRLSGDE